MVTAWVYGMSVTLFDVASGGVGSGGLTVWLSMLNLTAIAPTIAIIERAKITAVKLILLRINQTSPDNGGACWMIYAGDGVGLATDKKSGEGET